MDLFPLGTPGGIIEDLMAGLRAAVTMVDAIIVRSEECRLFGCGAVWIL
jgi:hypothetical protein